jgi:hypothetical protein
MSARDFVLQQLRANPNLTYAEVRDLASAAGLTVAPFLYGSMRRQLGLPPKVDAAAATGGKRLGDGALSDSDLAEAEDQIAGGNDDETEEGAEATPDGDDATDADAGAPDESADEPIADPLTAHALTMAMAGQTSARSRETRDAVGGNAAGDAMTGAPADPTADMAAVARAGAADAAPGREPKSSGFKFAVDALRLSPDLQYQDLKARAKLAGLSVPPIVYGRAKALLGLVPTRPRRSKGDAPRVLRQVDSAIDLSAPLKALPAGASESLRQLEQMIQTVRELEAENRHLRNALQAALTITSAALEEIE